MDIRNIQRTGSMHYIYLPTSWCKKYSISSDSKVSIEVNNDGTLTIMPQVTKKKQKDIKLEVSEKDLDIIVKLIMACYINPTHSFNIKLQKGINVTKLLDQKKAISGFEFVELDGNHITYESSMVINDPDSLLKTMVKKIKNLINVMITDYNVELINKYEEEIDRSKLLIDKSVTEALTLNEPSKLKPVELHYTALISQHLERMVDYIIRLDEKEKPFLKQLVPAIDKLKELLENLGNVNYNEGIEFLKNVMQIKKQKFDDIKSYNKILIRNNLINVSEIFLDWAITNQVD